MRNSMSHGHKAVKGADDALAFQPPPPAAVMREASPPASHFISQAALAKLLAELQSEGDSSTESEVPVRRVHRANEPCLEDMPRGNVIGKAAYDAKGRNSSENASLPLGAPSSASAHARGRMMALRDQRTKSATRAPDEGDDTGAAFHETGNAGRYRHRRCDQEESTDDITGGCGEKLCVSDRDDCSSESDGSMRRSGPDVKTTQASSVLARYASVRRRLGSTRRTENALPRMLALQRSFEAEAKHLYEYCGTHVLEWPTLAVEWIPDRSFVDPERDYTLQYLLVGTQAHPSSKVMNTVKVMEVAVPVTTTNDVMYGLYGDDDISGADSVGSALEEGVDPGKRFFNVKGHFHTEQTLTMDATVLKIRAMPAETNIIAVKTASGFIGVYNLVQDLVEDRLGHTVPNALLRGHRRGGFGLSWNPLKPGFIASGSDDGYVNYYDVSHRLTLDTCETSAVDPALSGSETQPLQHFVGHRDIVTDCSWHCSQKHLLASSSMDGDVHLWDIRASPSSTTIESAHPSGVTAAQFHPIGAFQLATAGAEGNIRLWDIRRTKDSIVELSYHGRSVTGLQWAPFSETVMLSYGTDGRVVLWDLAKTSLPLEYSVDQVAPPEVSFVHIGHTGRVTDASWNSSKREEWLLASADTTNGLQVYRPLRSVVQDYLAHEQ
ncbi:hypothetical protein JKF63_02893 [Porcisia hertigi]|uniref:Histone-binding protein RBBP4-like N-terminal domain-containing protein n=1 Tax=Porcisia hertigi TaxID=2761500 RepID=A0A836L667_9TRYP|nr:hypothetical protein JKF63_02893 [Porcisia hertigi]